MSNPKIGDVCLSKLDGNPFDTKRIKVKVLDVKDGYVQYQVDGCSDPTSCPLTLFDLCYGVVENSGGNSNPSLQFVDNFKENVKFALETLDQKGKIELLDRILDCEKLISDSIGEK